MPWIRRSSSEVHELRRKRKKESRRYGIFITVGACVFFASLLLVEDYFGERRIEILPYLAYCLVITGILILLEPLFETKFMSAWNRWILRYSTTVTRATRSLFAGIPHNPDLDIIDSLNEDETAICINCFQVQRRSKSRTCVKGGKQTESIDCWKWIDDEENEYLTNRESQ